MVIQQIQPMKKATKFKPAYSLHKKTKRENNFYFRALSVTHSHRLQGSSKKSHTKSVNAKKSIRKSSLVTTK